MSRDRAIAHAERYFDEGGFFADLARRVAIPTESQNPDRGADLARYLSAEMQHSFEKLGFKCRVLPNPLAKYGPFLLAERIENPGGVTVFSYGHGDVIRAGEEKGTDFWAFPKAGAEPAHQDHIKFEKIEGNGFVETLIWKDLEKKPLLNETRTVAVMAYPDGARIVDVTVKLSSATDGDVILALREGNSVYRLDLAGTQFVHLAGMGKQGYAGDGGPA